MLGSRLTVRNTRPRPGGTSGASFPDPDVLCRALRNAETLDGEGPFKAPGEEERQKTPPPPQEQKTSKEPTPTLEEGKATAAKPRR
ncbi:hypothetical protein NDU88_007680 [Pleurodeles waltl]|uniref:Uncharacterized protein n=1 Tax=Pleurodeles waltl TaxID=8319 RepID=A0AAV7STD8_PLEWA|nr:hypothetical protein NDU88_007680 [Pleurodeles waltl]